MNLLRARRQRTVDIEEEEEDEVDEVKEDSAQKPVDVSSTDGASPVALAKPRTVRKAVVRPMPLVLAG